MKKTEINIIPSIQPGTNSTRMDNSQIPVPVTSRPLEDSKGTSSRQETPENTVYYETSVAARKAQFQKYDSLAQPKLRNKNKSNKETQKPEVVKKNVITWTLTKSNDNISRMPNMWKPRSGYDPKTFAATSVRNDLQTRCNELENINTMLRTQLQESRNKLERLRIVHIEDRDLQRKYEQLQEEKNELEGKLQMEESRVKKFETVSKEMCKEYEQLKRQYDLEIGAMHQAMQQASEWYKQNRQLKRMSQLMMQHFMQNNPTGAPCMMSLDEVDTNSEDLDQLRQTVTKFSSEIARLQTELHSARLLEFEAQEQVTHLTMQLEEERDLRQKAEEKTNELMVYKKNMEEITKMVVKEVQDLTVQCDRERENAEIYKTEAEKIQKERDILAHQSALLMADVGDDSDTRLLRVLRKVESLKKEQERDRDLHINQILMAEKKLKEMEVEREIAEEKMKLAETELETVLKRADRAEKSVEKLENVVCCLRQEINELKEKSSIPPPPPPPPPPMPPMLVAKESTIKLLIKGKSDAEPTAVSKMEKMLGISPKKTSVPQQLAIDDIINQIKGGHFTLKQTDKQREERKKRQEAENASPAVSEMLNILGIMRRRAKPTRQLIKHPDASS